MRASKDAMAMRLFRRILVPYDFSDHAQRALEVAAGLAAPGSTITVLHAMTPVQMGIAGPAGDLAWTPPPDLVTELQDRLETLVARVGTGPSGPRPRCRVVLSDPVSAIIAAAKRADVIVMTTVGRTGLGHFLMGSVAEKVVRHATIPVLTLHPGAAKRLATAGASARRKARPSKPASAPRRRVSAR